MEQMSKRAGAILSVRFKTRINLRKKNLNRSTITDMIINLKEPYETEI